MDTAQVRELVIKGAFDKPYYSGGREQMDQAGQEFDAWLDKIRADARKAALEEAVQVTSRVRDRYVAQLRRTR